MQQWLEANKNPSLEPGTDEKTDLAAYEWIFTNLKNEPRVSIPYGFADRVSREAKLRHYQRGDRSLYLIIGVLCFSGISLGMGALFILNSPAGKLLVDNALQFKWTLLFVVMVFGFVQWIDQRRKLQMIKKMNISRD